MRADERKHPGFETHGKPLADPEFPREGAATYYFAKKNSENCMEMKEFGS